MYLLLFCSSRTIGSAIFRLVAAFENTKCDSYSDFGKGNKATAHCLSHDSYINVKVLERRALIFFLSSLGEEHIQFYEKSCQVASEMKSNLILYGCVTLRAAI